MYIIYKNRTNANQIVGGIPIKSVIKSAGYLATNSAVLAQYQQITCAFCLLNIMFLISIKWWQILHLSQNIRHSYPSNSKHTHTHTVKERERGRAPSCKNHHMWWSLLAQRWLAETVNENRKAHTHTHKMNGKTDRDWKWWFNCLKMFKLNLSIRSKIIEVNFFQSK